MMRTSALLLSMLLAPVAFGKGMAFSYTMEGYVYDQATKDVLRNTTLMIGEQVIMTDERGWYAVRISGITCDLGSRVEIKRCNDARYGSLVIRRLFSNSSTTVRTNWADHACLDRIAFTPPCHVSRRDLFVP
jgi:hypothetical protein